MTISSKLTTYVQNDSRSHRESARAAHLHRATGGIASRGEILTILIIILFFSVLVVGTDPFTGGNAISIDKSGDGDVLRQILLVILCIISIPIIYVRRRILFIILRNNPFILILFIFGLISVTWSSVPDIAFRREMGAILCAELSLLAVTLKPRNYINLLLFFTGAIMLVDYAGLIVAPTLSLDHSGMWVGLHSQKNVAGYFSAIATLVWLSVGCMRGNKMMVLASLAWFLFLIMTGSKTSIAILIPCFIMAIYIYYGLRKSFFLGDFIIISSILISFISVTLIMILSMPQVDPAQISFTGRTRIWAFVWSNILKAPFLGVGYGSFWAIGDTAPALREASPFVAQYTEAHNGYLDVLVMLGVVGLATAIFALLKPYWHLVRSKPIRRQPMLVESIVGAMAILTFGILHNFLESSVMQGLNWLWAITLIAAWRGTFELNRRKF